MRHELANNRLWQSSIQSSVKMENVYVIPRAVLVLGRRLAIDRVPACSMVAAL